MPHDNFGRAAPTITQGTTEKANIPLHCQMPKNGRNQDRKMSDSSDVMPENPNLRVRIKTDRNRTKGAEKQAGPSVRVFLGETARECFSDETMMIPQKVHKPAEEQGRVFGDEGNEDSH